MSNGEASTTGAAGAPPATENRSAVVRLLLVCGLLSSGLYAAMLTFVPMMWGDYSSASGTVSELSAIGAPTRPLWVSLALVWTLLYVAFGAGVWLAAEGRALRAVGAVIIVAGTIGLFWPPMHLREVLAQGGGTLTDTLHIVWTIVNGVLTLLAMGLGAAAMGNRFRGYSIATMVVLLAAGAMTSREAPGVDANLPTPWIGVWERVNLGAWLLWVAVLAAVLLRRTSQRPAPQAVPAGALDGGSVS
jgi:hypothetical protein